MVEHQQWINVFDLMIVCLCHILCRSFALQWAMAIWVEVQNPHEIIVFLWDRVQA
jgi:hypothetical protein